MNKINCAGCEERVGHKDLYRCDICEERFCEDCMALDDESTICPECLQSIREDEGSYYQKVDERNKELEAQTGWKPFRHWSKEIY